MPPFYLILSFGGFHASVDLYFQMGIFFVCSGDHIHVQGVASQILHLLYITIEIHFHFQAIQLRELLYLNRSV